MSCDERSRQRRLPLAYTPSSSLLVDVEVDSLGNPGTVNLKRGMRVLRSWGPERIVTGWWRQQKLYRDGFWVELEDGRRLFIARDLKTSNWRLVGEFL